MKTRLTFAALACLAPAMAAATTETELANQFFSNDNPTLTAQEKAGLAISQKWVAGAGASMAPLPGPDGSIRFVFGQSQPSIVCAVMQVCDVELEPGEQVSSVNLGDAVRWLVEPALSGTGGTAVQHLVIKPLDVGLETSLMVTTDRRTYHFRLRSHRTEYMPRVAFTYPGTVEKRWEALRRHIALERASAPEQAVPAAQPLDTGENLLSTVAGTAPPLAPVRPKAEYLSNLDFRYRVSGSAPFRPARVYNDGAKTIIEMPPTIAQGEAPTLMVLRESGSAFRKDDEVMVNYRLQDGRFVVDTVFQKAVLIAGVGMGQRRITIERRH